MPKASPIGKIASPTEPETVSAALTGKLIGLPGVLHVTSHLTMKSSRPTTDGRTRIGDTHD
jgi:hypothetical protein